MKLNISLSFFNGHSASAHIADSDDNSLEIALKGNPKPACREAAKALRQAAARFDLLADEDEPFKVTTHARINRTKVEAVEATSLSHPTIPRILLAAYRLQAQVDNGELFDGDDDATTRSVQALDELEAAAAALRTAVGL